MPPKSASSLDALLSTKPTVAPTASSSLEKLLQQVRVSTPSRSNSRCQLRRSRQGLLVLFNVAQQKDILLNSASAGPRAAVLYPIASYYVWPLQILNK
jgi:hypothetical protein